MTLLNLTAAKGLRLKYYQQRLGWKGAKGLVLDIRLNAGTYDVGTCS